MTSPKIDDAPGLAWKPRKSGLWEARWQARTDLVERGYQLKSERIWTGKAEDIDEGVADYIRQRCRPLQDDMLVWGRGGALIAGEFDDSIGSLMKCYHTDPESPYHEKRYCSRKYYDALCAKIEKTVLPARDGVDACKLVDVLVENIDARMLRRLHVIWSANGKVATGHAVMGMVRSLMTFGSTLLNDAECLKVKVLMHGMKFKTASPRTEALTAQQAADHRAMSHRIGKPSIALAQAIQFECALRQKDVIGEWVPLNERDMSTVIHGNEKWLRGVQWQEIGADLVLRHVTSKRQKMLEISLRNAPMVMEELCLKFGATPATLTRDMLPKDGPIVVDERSQQPWGAYEFRRWWRLVADKCEIPKSVRNMDSRAGAITEATDAGAELEHVRAAATHSDIGMTQKYSRGEAKKIANVQRIRVEHRNKTGT